MAIYGKGAMTTRAALIAIGAYGAIGFGGRRLVGYVPEILLSTPRQAPRSRALTRIIETGGIALFVLILWHVAMDAFDLNRFFAKRPLDVGVFLSEATNRKTILAALAETLAFTVPGYLAGLFLGAALALVLKLLPGWSRWAVPFAISLRAVPIITTALLLVLAFGRGMIGTTVFVAVMIFFPTFVACQQGVRQTPGQITDLFQSYRASRWHLMRAAQVPSMLPAFFASARMAVPAALLAVTTVEWLAQVQAPALAMIHDLPWRAEIVGKTHDGDYAAALRKQCGDLHLTPASHSVVSWMPRCWTQSSMRHPCLHWPPAMKATVWS